MPPPTEEEEATEEKKAEEVLGRTDVRIGTTGRKQETGEQLRGIIITHRKQVQADKPTPRGKKRGE